MEIPYPLVKTIHTSGSLMKRMRSPIPTAWNKLSRDDHCLRAEFLLVSNLENLILQMTTCSGLGRWISLLGQNKRPCQASSGWSRKFTFPNPTQFMWRKWGACFLSHIPFPVRRADPVSNRQQQLAYFHLWFINHSAFLALRLSWIIYDCWSFLGRKIYLIWHNYKLA